jgi:tetratricopeptide (TPR) repeat protein
MNSIYKLAVFTVMATLVIATGCKQSPKYTEEQAAILNDSAFAIMMDGRYEEALPLLNDIIAGNADYAMTYANRGTIYADQAEYEKCLQDYIMVNKLDPSAGTQIPMLIGALYDRTGEPKKALPYYNEVRDTLNLQITRFSAQTDPTGEEMAARMNLMIIELLREDPEGASAQVAFLESRYSDSPMLDILGEMNKESILEDWFPTVPLDNNSLDYSE